MSCKPDLDNFVAESFVQLAQKRIHEMTLESLVPAAITELDEEKKDGLAINALAQRLLPFLESYIPSTGRYVDDIEETANEVLAIVLARLSNFDPETGSLKGWAAGIARHVLREKSRREKRRQTPPKTKYETRHDEQYHIRQRLEEHQKADLLGAILSLSDEDQHLLKLLLLDGMEAPEAAHILHLSPDQVRQRKSRLMKKLGSTAAAIINPDNHSN